MTEDERKAVEWLDDLSEKWSLAHARTIKSMLARPVLPEEPSLDALVAIGRGGLASPGAPWEASVYRALYAHLSRSATKEVERWHVEYAQFLVVDGTTGRRDWCAQVQGFDTEAEAQRKAVDVAHCEATCIRVTGPHKQTVPA